MSDLWDRFVHEFGQRKSEEEAAAKAEEARLRGEPMDPILRQVAEGGQAFGSAFNWLTRPIRAAAGTYGAGYEEATGLTAPTPVGDAMQGAGQAFEHGVTGTQKVGEFLGAKPSRDEARALMDIGLMGLPFAGRAGQMAQTSKAGVAVENAAQRMMKGAEQAIIQKAPGAVAERLLKFPKTKTLDPLVEVPGSNILDELRANGSRVYDTAPTSKASMGELFNQTRETLYDKLLDQNAPFERLDKALTKRTDPGIGMGPGKGFGSEAAAEQGSLRNRTAALTRGGWYEQHKPFKARGAPYESMEAAVKKLGADGWTDANNYLVAKRELARYHGAKNAAGDAAPLRGMFDETTARNIVDAVEGGGDATKAIRDVAKQYDVEMGYLADQMEKHGVIPGSTREAWRKNPYVHLSRVMDPDFVATAQGKAAGNPFARVKGVTDDVAGTMSPLATYHEVVQQALAAIDRGRFARGVAEAWKRKPDQLSEYFTKVKRPSKRIEVYQDEIAAEMRKAGLSDDAVAEALSLDQPMSVWRKGRTPMAEAGEFSTFAPDGSEVWFQATPKGKAITDIVFKLNTKDYGLAGRMAEAATGLRRAGITQYNPAWWVYQIGADSLGSWSKTAQTGAFGLPSTQWYANHAKAMGGGLYEAIKHTARPLFQGDGAFSKWMKTNPEWERFKASGSLAGTYSHANPFQPSLSLEKAALTGGRGLFPDLINAVKTGQTPGWVKYYQKRVKDTVGARGIRGAPKLAGDLVMDPLHFLGEFGEISESIPRVGEHMGIRQIQGLAGQAADVPIPRPMQLQNQLGGARVTMPFQRGGTTTATANRFLLPFVKAWSNAILQEGKMAKHNPGAFAARRLAIAGLGAAAWYHNKDKESFKDANDFEKGQYISLYFDDAIDFGFGPVTGVHLMSAREDAAAFKAVEYALSEVDKLDPEAANRMARAYIEKMQYDMKSSFILAPIYEAALGKRVFSDQDINPAGLAGLSEISPERVRRPTTPEFFDWLNTSIPFTDSPMTDAEMEHMADSLVGSGLMDATSALQRMAGVKDEPKGSFYDEVDAEYVPEPRDRTPLGRFFRRHSSSRSTREFFDRFKRIDALTKLHRNMMEEGSTDDAWKSLDLIEADPHKKSAMVIRQYLSNLSQEYRNARTDEARLEIAKDMRQWARDGLRVLDIVELERLEKTAKDL